MRKQKAKRNMMGIFLLVVMGITLLTPGMGMNEAKAALLVAISPQNFPDDVFRQWVGDNCDKDGDGQLDDAERLNCTEIDVTDAGITSLEGIEFFPNLQHLCSKNNFLSSLDVSKNTALEQLHCSYNNISSLDVSKNSLLSSFDCSYNNISSLDVSKNSLLRNFECSYNNISSLDVSKNPALVALDCGNNNLNSLDVSKNPQLWGLYCSFNNLTVLDVSKNPQLNELECNANSLSHLDLSHNPQLHRLDCRFNLLVSLDLSKNTNLDSFIKPKLTQNIRIPAYKNGDEYYIDLSDLPVPLDDRTRFIVTDVMSTYHMLTNRINLSKPGIWRWHVDDIVWCEYDTNGPASIGGKRYMDVGLVISEVRDITPTTEEATTEEPTTEEPTTEEATTEEPTTEEPTTEEATTEEPTTEEATTEEATTEEPTTAVPAPTQADNGKAPAPQTGDTTPLYPVISLLLVSFVGGVTLYIRRKKKL